jgi:hypothetical protein
MKYKFKYRRYFFFKTFKVVGHSHDKDQDKMLLFFEDGGLREIKDWKKCEVILGTDWVLAVKAQMEKETGQKIN